MDHHASHHNSSGSPPGYNMLSFQPVPLNPAQPHFEPTQPHHGPAFYHPAPVAPSVSSSGPPPFFGGDLPHFPPVPPPGMPALPSVPLPPTSSATSKATPASKKPKAPRKRKSAQARREEAAAKNTARPDMNVPLNGSIRPSQGVPTPSPSTSSEPASDKSHTPTQNKEQQMRDFVLRLLGSQSEEFQEAEFAERALLNLTRKVFQTDGLPEQWAQVVRDQATDSTCVSVGRPKDGRMTVQKPGNGGTKKVFPQIILCQTFRWPNIVFHNDIKSTVQCQYPALIKPPEEAVMTDTICINPYHYELTSECIARFNKAARAAQRKSSLKKTSPAAKKVGKKASVAQAGPTPAGPSVSEPKNRAEPKVFDPQGVDYVKYWKDHSVAGEKAGFQKFSKADLLKEIKFLRIDRECLKGKSQEWEPEFIEGLKILNELDPILSGEYLNHIKPKPEVKDVKVVHEQVPSPSLGPPLLPPPAPVKPTTKTKAKSNAGRKPKNSAKLSSTAKQKISEPPPKPEPKLTTPTLPPPTNNGTISTSQLEDSTIQDLLNDIQGSFERQFDDEFENISNEVLGANGAEDDAVVGNFSMDTSAFPGYSSQSSSNPHSVTPSSRSRSSNSADSNPFDSQSHMGVPMMRSPPAEAPCIVDAWSMPNSGGSSNNSTGNSYLGANPGDFTNGGQMFQPPTSGSMMPLQMPHPHHVQSMTQPGTHPMHHQQPSLHHSTNSHMSNMHHGANSGNLQHHGPPQNGPMMYGGGYQMQQQQQQQQMHPDQAYGQNYGGYPHHSGHHASMSHHSQHQHPHTPAYPEM